jgi:hypothetical protein
MKMVSLLPSASVTIKGTSTGTTTNENGSFTISVPAGGVLVISSVGYTNKEVTIGSESNLTIVLAANNQQLEQGYSNWIWYAEAHGGYGCHLNC